MTLNRKTSSDHLPPSPWMRLQDFFQKLESAYRKFFVRKNPYYRYLLNCLDTILRAMLLMVTTFILCVIFLFFVKVIWSTLIYTPVGERFLRTNAEIGVSIHNILNRDLGIFSSSLVLTAFKISIITGIICQFFHILNLFYFSMGKFGQILWWGIPLSLIVGFVTKEEYAITRWEPLIVLSFLTTMCLFPSCFKFARILIPELGDMFQSIKQFIIKRMNA